GEGLGETGALRTRHHSEDVDLPDRSRLTASGLALVHLGPVETEQPAGLARVVGDEESRRVEPRRCESCLQVGTCPPALLGVARERFGVGGEPRVLVLPPSEGADRDVNGRRYVWKRRRLWSGQRASHPGEL